MQKRILLTSMVAATLLFTGCGGGGGGGSEPSSSQGGSSSNQDNSSNQGGSSNQDSNYDTNIETIELIGDEAITLNVGDELPNLGVILRNKNGDVIPDGDCFVEVFNENKSKLFYDLNLEISTVVNTSIINEYTITYTAYNEKEQKELKVEKKIIVTMKEAEKVDTIINVLLSYDKTIDDFYHGEAKLRLEYLMEATNAMTLSSGISLGYNITIVLSGKEGVVSDGLSNEERMDRFQHYATEMKKDMKEHHFDILIGVGKREEGSTTCGIAFTGQAGYNKDDDGNMVKDTEVLLGAYPFASISADCDFITLPHEIGHLYGLIHDEVQGGEGIKPYARGYGVEGEFGTIMTYSSDYKTGHTIPVYSSPDLMCGDYPCGVAENEAHEAHAVKIINKYKDQIAAWR